MKSRIPNQSKRTNQFTVPLQLLPPEEMDKLTPEQQAQINAASINLKRAFEQASNNSFVMGGRAISKIAMKDYKPDIDAAKDYESLRKSVNKLFEFLAKGENLR